MDLIIVVGARPNFIKIGPLVPALRAAGIGARIAHTGQHYDATMSGVFFRDLMLPEPDWFLGVGSGKHAVQTGTAMIRLEELLEAERPDALVVVGDVNSTLAGALAAAKVHVPVVHLEAGLRSFDLSMPEEVNRLVTDQLSAMLLAPTPDAVENLQREGLDPDRIHFVGNIMAESVLRNLPLIEGREAAVSLGLKPKQFVLATIHRPENTDQRERLSGVLEALRAAPLPVLLPAHPRTRPLLEAAGWHEGGNLGVVAPVGYLDMLALQRDAAVVVTDSGGVQEESCMLDTPCVTVRRNTERAVTVDVGANRLVTAEPESIAGGIRSALGTVDAGWPHPERWDDLVSSRVVRALEAGIRSPSGYGS